MALAALISAFITGLVYACVAALMVGIVLANLYAVLHAWRMGRVGWRTVLAVLFLTGGALATAAYLFIHHDEPMPSLRRRALA